MVDDSRQPRTISSDWILKRIQEGKIVRLKNAVIEGDLDLSKLSLPVQHAERTKDKLYLGYILKIIESPIKISHSTIQNKLRFSNSFFNKYVIFDGTTFNENVEFNGVTFSGPAWFDGATFVGDAQFYGAIFCKPTCFHKAIFGIFAWFDEATFKETASFDGATFNEAASFGETSFRKETNFDKATFMGFARFDKATFIERVWFTKVNFDKQVLFSRSNFCKQARFDEIVSKGDMLTFRDAIFIYANSQEDACRRAKNILSKAGNREEEEYHFYKEMEAKRKQRGIFDISSFKPKTFQTLRAENLSIIRRFLWYDVIENVFVQKMFGYGVHPIRLMISWGAIVLVFSFFYWHGKGLFGTTDWLDYFKVSFATAIAPGYIAAIINPESGGYRLVSEYQLVAMIETIIGTFLWAGFIATFAKKYMR
jgi:hypothetical protein